MSGTHDYPPLVFDRVSFSYPQKTAVLDNFSLTLPGKGIFALSGPSGCGKTTILRLMAGLEMPAKGTISGLENRRVSVVFQENRLLPWIPARDNIALVIGGDKTFRTRAAEQWLAHMGLSGEGHKPPAQLSGGMKRRVAIARALAAEADTLLLDEPFNGLDRALWTEVASKILEIYADKLVILVTHVEDQAKVMSAEVIRL